MRWLWRILGAILVLAVLGLGAILLIPTESVARLASQKFEELTGRELTLEGDVSPSFWPVLGVTTGPVRIANADWSDAEAPFFKADSLRIAINASALLGGDLEILGVEAETPVLVLERARDGRENWVFGGGGAGGEISTETPGVGSSYSLESLVISNGTLRFIDWGKKSDQSFENIEMTLSAPEYGGPFDVKAEARVSGQSLSMTLQGGIWSSFTEGGLVPLSLTAKAGGTQIGFDGRGGWQPLTAEGKLTANLADLPALGALMGQTLSQPPAGFGAERLEVSGLLTLDPKGVFYLRGARIVADENSLSGDLDLRTDGPRPKISAQLAADRLALSQISRGSGGGAKGGMSAPGWPEEEIDVSALGLVDAEIGLSANAVDLGVLNFGQTRALLLLERARAVFDLRQLEAYGGAVTGEFVVNGRGGLSVGGKLSVANMQAQPLMRDLSGWDRLISNGNLTLNFLGVGNSVDQIMRSLEGSGHLALGKGEILGLDIAGMLRSLDTAYVGEGQKTIFDGIAGSFTIEKGNLRNEDLKLLAPYLTASGAGRIGLGARDLDYSIRPTAFPGQDGTGGVMVPLRITGSWADPTYRLDLESVAREKMEAEAKEAEARAKAELEAKMERELGVERQAGESLEDAMKRRAGEALGKEAGRLLDGLLGGRP